MARRPSTLKGSLEAKTWDALAKRKTIKVEYEPDKIKYIRTHQYLPDFKITKKDGSFFYVETKGYFRPNDRAKLRAVKEQNPGLDLRLVFQRDQPIYKGSPTYYSKWAEDHGFPWAIGEVPEGWLK